MRLLDVAIAYFDELQGESPTLSFAAKPTSGGYVIRTAKQVHIPLEMAWRMHNFAVAGRGKHTGYTLIVQKKITQKDFSHLSKKMLKTCTLL